MKRHLSYVLGLLWVVELGACAVAKEGLMPTHLRTEHRIDPLGIDVARPRLSWKVESAERGQAQTAYRVLVASDPALLEQEKADLWDSGKIASDRTADVAYEGPPLPSRGRAHWRVRVWDRNGRALAWSEPALWTAGLLEEADWQATWIGYDEPLARRQAELDFGAARWIWFHGDPPLKAPARKRYFRAGVEIPAGIRILEANLLITADDRFRLFVNDRPIAIRDGSQGAWNRAGPVDIASALTPGRNILAIEAENGQPGAAGLLARLVVAAADREPVVLVTDASWKCAEKPAEGWQGEAFDDSGWPAAAELSAYGGGPWRRVAPSAPVLPPPRYLRKEFRLKKPVRRAMAYASALGLCELRINGRRVGSDYFTPGWTDYQKRVYYRAYDVADLLKEGDNAVAAIVADGWYAGYVGFGRERDHYGDKIRLLAQIDVEYADGSMEIVASGPSWKASTGPLLEADFLMGEAHDARKAMPGWDAPGFDDSGWRPVDSSGKTSAKLEAHPGPPVRELAPIAPIDISEPRPGSYVFNMGQNFAGVVRLRVRGEAGRRIVLRFAERLNPDGTIYTTNLRSARAMDTYVCRGGEEEIWQPRFTFHGFQYVEVTGYPGKPSLDTVTGIPFSSDTPVVGEFSCSDEMVNQLFSNIYWTQRMNFIDIPTDCPQRDERLGWTGDAQVYIRTASLIADVQAFFTKWLVDLEDAQRADGQFPMIAPLKSRGPTADGGPAWADAGVICPWTVYEIYGDKRILERHYDSMARFIAFCRNRSTKDLLPPEKFHCFGDWLNIDADTPKDVIYTAYFAYSTRLTGQAAEVLGKASDASELRELFGRIKGAFNKAYVAADGRIKGDTQTCYVLAIAFDLLDGDKRKLAARYLTEDIEKRGWHLSTGFIGTKDLMLVLAKIGRNDIAYRLLHNTTFPSWGFSIKHGATTIWERWNGWTPEQGFGDPGMNSFAHYSFGAVYQWVFENIGGINTDGPAFKRIVIRPRPGGKIRWAKVSYDSIHGEIASDWRMEGPAFRLSVTVPANTSATVYVPAEDAGGVTEGGKPASEAEAVKFLRAEGGRAVYEVGSGRYAFVSPRSGLEKPGD